MLHRVNFSRPLFREMYGIIYDRIAKAAEDFGDPEGVAPQRMQRLTALDPMLHLLVDIDIATGSIIAHCLVAFQQVDEALYEPFVEQLVADSGHAREFTLACIAYMEALPITKIRMITTEGKARAFKRSYGFEVVRVVMERSVRRQVTQEE